MKGFAEYSAVAVASVLLVSCVSAEIKPGEHADAPKTLEITGKVRVLRNESDNKVKEITVITEDGRAYIVLLDETGKKLAKLLKSRIVKITGEMRDVKGGSFLVVHKSEVIGPKKKTEAPSGVAAVAGPDAVTAVKPEEKTQTVAVAKSEIKTVPKPENKIEIKPAAKAVTNAEAAAEVKAAGVQVSKPETNVTVQIDFFRVSANADGSVTNGEAGIENKPAHVYTSEEKTNGVILVKSNAVFSLPDR